MESIEPKNLDQNQIGIQQQHPPQNHEKLKRQKTKYTPSNVPFRMGYQCYFVLLGLTLFSLSLSSYILFEQAMDYYEFIIANWHQQPINSIRMTTGACDSNEEALIDYRWPGTVDGCDCRYRRRMLYERRQLFIRKDKIYNNHACNITQLAFGCTSVYAMDPITFDKFPDITGRNGFQICAIRETNNDFYYTVPKSQDCPTGEQKCGSQDDYFYCTKQKDCPIKKIGIKGQIILENQQEGNSISTQTLIYTRNMTNSLPIVEFKVSEAGVCFRNNERGMSAGRIDYSLMRENKTDCATDPRFEPILISNEYNYYLANGQSDLSTKLRGYSISPDYQWGIYQRTYIQWKMSCRGKVMNEFLEQQVYLNDILDSQTSLLIISIIFMVVISFILTFISCANIKGYDWPCISGRGTEESNYIFYLEIFLKTVIQLPHAIIIIISFARVSQEINYLDDVILKDCSDQYVASQLTDLKDTLIQNVYGFNLGQLIIFFITTAGDLFIAFYLCQSYYKEKRLKFQQSQQGNTFEMQPNYNPVPQQPIQPNHDYQDYPQQIPVIQQNPYQQNQQQNPYLYNQQQNPYYPQQQQQQQQNPFNV